MSNRTKANRPCDDDYAALEEVYSRLLEKHNMATVSDAIAFMQYAATSQLNRNFVIFTGDYQTVNDVLGITLEQHADTVLYIDEAYGAAGHQVPVSEDGE